MSKTYNTISYCKDQVILRVLSSFKRVLDRGFSLVIDSDGNPIKLSSEAPKNANIKIKFADELRSAKLDG